MPEFQPPALLKNHHLQSGLASISLRQAGVQRRAAPFLQSTVPEVIHCASGVRLLAEHTPPRGKPGRAAVLIHGWEGSARSMYMVSVAARLARTGFRVIRLNLRDHGGSHHLNTELFHSCRLEEVVQAIQVLQARYPDERFCLGGFSLGGNFALRIAACAGAAGLRIEQVAAICPVLDPRATMSALDNGLPYYRQYFIRKWRRSLAQKQRVFPEIFEFGELARFRELGAMTEYFVSRYTEFADLDSYLRGYAVTEDRLASLDVPTEILLADDDPVIPVADARRLALTPALCIRRSRHGGHCGFISNYRLESWLDSYCLGVFGA